MEHAARNRRQEIAAALEMTPSLLSKQLNPDDALNNFPLKKFRRFLRAAASQLPLELLCREEGGVFVRLPDVETTDEEIYAACLKQAEELGQASEKIRRALSPDSDGGTALTLMEAQDCARELEDVAEAAMRARAIVLARISAKPSSLRMQLTGDGARRSA